MSQLKKLFTNVRIWLLIVFVVLSLVAINPRGDVDGVAIRGVAKDSAAAAVGLQSPAPTVSPTHRERLLEVNFIPVNSIAEYHAALGEYEANQSITITTTSGTHQLLTIPIAEFDEESNESVVVGVEDIGISVYAPPKNNLRLGLDLSGGTRVVLKPETRVSADDLELIIDNIEQRLNVYGLSDIIVRDARDLSGDDFIIVEIAGVNQDEVRELLSSQGKFEAHIGDNVVFRGGQDITFVCRTAECSGLDVRTGGSGCGAVSGGYSCRFSFEIRLTPEAAKRQADATRDLEVIYNESVEGYLSEPLELYLDDELVDSLQISSGLKGQEATSILISGSGLGATQAVAAEDAIANMKTMQTVLVTGSLPVKLEIVKSDGISPALGEGFLNNALWLCLMAVLAVAIVIGVRYRKPLVSLPVMITMLSEVTIILGFAALVGWNLDLAAFAAILIAIGSGVDDQIVLLDETLSTRTSRRSWKERLSSAFFIIFASFFTLVAAMFPLLFAGAGLLRGFAITTLVGVTAGVLITRPAFAQFIQILLKQEE